MGLENFLAKLNEDCDDFAAAPLAYTPSRWRVEPLELLREVAAVRESPPAWSAECLGRWATTISEIAREAGIVLPPPLARYLARLRHHERFEERAAILEFDAGLDRHEAEVRAEAAIHQLVERGVLS